MKSKEKEEVSVFELQIKKYKQRRAIVIAVVCIALLAAGFYVINRYMTKDYNSYEVLNTEDREDSNAVKYISYNHNLVKYSRDGISALSPGGKKLWNTSYDVKNPKVATSGSYVAIADIGGKQVYTFDGKGNTYTITTTLPITDVSIANQGVVCVTVEGNDYNQVILYNSVTGIKLVEKQTSVQSNGYPVDVAISSDGMKMVCSYVRIENGVLESDIGFYSFSDVGDNYESNLVGAVKDKQIITHDVVFLNKDKVLLCSDKGFVLYEMYEIPSEIITKTFDDEIISMFYTDNYFGYILKDSNNENNKKLLLYNLKGKNILNKDISFNYENVQMSGEDIIFNTETEVYIMNVNGNMKFKYTFDNPVVSIMPSNDKDEYIIINDQTIEHIKLVEDKKK